MIEAHKQEMNGSQLGRSWTQTGLTVAAAAVLLFGGGQLSSVSAQSEGGDGRLSRSTPETRSQPAPRSVPRTRAPSSRGSGNRSGSVGRSGSRGRHMSDGSRHRRSGSRYGRRGVRSYRYGYGHSYGFGSYYRSPWFYSGLGYPFSWWVGSSYGPWGYGYSPYGRYGHSGGYYRGDAAALDLDISPEEASIYVDGKLVGIADQYDGFPRYLWLDAGTHNVVIYHEGFQTLAKRITMDGGDRVRLKDKMVPGVAKSPEEMYAQLRPVTEAKTRDAGRAPLAPWRYEDDNAGEGQTPVVATRRPRTGESVTGEVKDGATTPRSRSPRSAEAWRERRAAARTVDTASVDLRSAPAQVRLVVEPSDAAIYVNGKLIGSAADLNEMAEPILLDAGDHVVEVSRPGYEGKRTEFAVKSDERKTVTVTLDRQ